MGWEFDGALETWILEWDETNCNCAREAYNDVMGERRIQEGGLEWVGKVLRSMWLGKKGQMSNVDWRCKCE